MCQQTFCCWPQNWSKRFPRLFVAIAERVWSQAISSQRISKWISGCIVLCYQQTLTWWYQLSDLSPPSHGIRAHSTSAQATFVALLQEVSLLDISKAVCMEFRPHVCEVLRFSSGLLCWGILWNGGPSFGSVICILAPLLLLEYCLSVTYSEIHIGTSTERRR